MWFQVASSQFPSGAFSIKLKQSLRQVTRKEQTDISCFFPLREDPVVNQCMVHRGSTPAYIDRTLDGTEERHYWKRLQTSSRNGY